MRRKRTVTDRSIHGVAAGPGPRVVESAADLLAPTTDRWLTWTARASQHYPENPALVVDLCWNGVSDWRPWDAGLEPYDSVPLTYCRVRDALLFVRSALTMPAPFVTLEEMRPIWAGLLEPMPGTTEVAPDPPVVDLDAARPRQIVEGMVLSLCHVYGHGYGHWFADAVPPLLDLLPAVQAGRLRVLMPPMLAWQRRTLELLGVPGRMIIECSYPTVGCRDLICHTFSGVQHAQRPGVLLGELYRRLRQAAGQDSAAPRFIYASRRGLRSWRNFANEAEVEAAMETIGFTILRPETMTLDQQIAAFSRAEVIAGPHGSAQGNAGFAPPGCIIVSILPENFEHRWIYGIARHLDHRLVELVAGRQGEHNIHFHPTIYAIPPALVVERTLAAMERFGVKPRSAAA